MIVIGMKRFLWEQIVKERAIIGLHIGFMTASAFDEHSRLALAKNPLTTCSFYLQCIWTSSTKWLQGKKRKT